MNSPLNHLWGAFFTPPPRSGGHVWGKTQPITKLKKWDGRERDSPLVVFASIQNIEANRKLYSLKLQYVDMDSK